MVGSRLCLAWCPRRSILNRFSRDQTVVDQELPDYISDAMACWLQTVRWWHLQSPRGAASVSHSAWCGTIGLPPHHDRRRHAGVCVISTVHHAGVSQHLRVRACARWLRAVWLFPHAQRPQCACLFSRVSPMHGWLRVPGSYYRATARELKRLEAISFSPIQNKFGETVDGLASIRAFGLQVRWRCAWCNGALAWPPTSFVSAVE